MVSHYYGDILGTESQSSLSTKTQDMNIMNNLGEDPGGFPSTKGETNTNSHLDPMQAQGRLKRVPIEPLPENGLILTDALNSTH